MSAFIAALPMYDWPECRAETDAEWTRLRQILRTRGIDAPDLLVRCNADMPAVPGGIRDRSGAVVAPDPATLPPEDLDLPTLWRHPNLLLAQTCWGPMEAGLASQVQVIGQPDYSGFEGGAGELYSSAIVVRRAEVSPSASLGIVPSGLQAGDSSAGNVPAPANGDALIPVALLRGKRFAYSEPVSMSGFLGLKRDLEAARESLSLFSRTCETGSHRASLLAVAEEGADVCAVDCRTWSMARRFEAAARDLAVLGWTAKRKGLPLVGSAALPEALVLVLRDALGACVVAGPAGQADSLSSSG